MRQDIQRLERGEAGRRGFTIHGPGRESAGAQKRCILIRLDQEGRIDRLDRRGACRAGRTHRLFMQIALKAGSLGVELAAGREGVAELRLIQCVVHRRRGVLHFLGGQHRPVVRHEGGFDRAAQLQAGVDRVPAHGKEQEEQWQQAEVEPRA